jgi:DNA-binding response OmpR family regulator
MSNKKVLIIEDDADVRLGYHVILKAHQYDTFFAADALSSIAEARKHQPDVIILDLGLPAGDGFAVLARLQSNTYLAIIPLIVVSVRDIHTNRERALKAGAKAYLQKPWNDEDLLALLADLLGEKKAAASQHE